MGEAFAIVPISTERSRTKPRRSGLTMMMDWGIPLGKQADLLELVGPFVDLAKIVVGTARFYDDGYLIRKLDRYRTHTVEPFLGGQFLEYVLDRQGLDGVQPYCEEARRLGFGTIEVSDNIVEIAPAERHAIVDLAVEWGLQVHGEVGSKADVTAPADLVAQARDWFDLGAEIVLVEAAELVIDGNPNRPLLAALASELDPSMLMFELPGPWVRGTTASDVLYLKKFLIDSFGPDVNIANVMPDELFETEAMRVGLSFGGPLGSLTP